jgi:DNA-binding CsgD family transcriptional regulator
MNPSEQPRPAARGDDPDGHRAAWDAAEARARVGRWDWDLDNGRISWSPNMYRLLGYEPGEFAPTIERVLDRVHPSDRPQVEAELDPAVRTADPLELRVVLPDGSVRHLYSAPGRDGTRTHRRMVGIVRDVTELRLAEREAALHGRVACALAEWQDFRSGGERMLAEVAGTLSMPRATLLLAEEGSLVPRATWSENGAGSGGEAAAGAVRIASEQLAAEARERRRTVLAPAGSPGSARGEAMMPALAIAATDEEQVAAVIVLYDHGPPARDARLVSALEQVGRTIGAFLGRRAGALGVPLTPRETEVLRLAARGLSGSEIAEELQLSSATVKTHLAHTYAKIGASNRVAAVAYALREGLIE